MWTRFFIVSVFLHGFLWGNENGVNSHQPRQLQFPSLDGVPIFADWYRPYPDSTTPVVVLFHQAGYSRGEYQSSVDLFLNLGFNALAVDLRSGKTVNGVLNETHKIALEKGKPVNYVDAEQDIQAALLYGRRLTQGKLVAVGSSYSAGLLACVAGNFSQVAEGVVLFSPGEYFFNQGRPSNWVQSLARSIEIPVFITSSKQETNSWEEIYAAIKSKHKVSFIPNSPGQHGARVLWKESPFREEYWKPLSAFLHQFVKRDSVVQKDDAISVK